MDGADDLQQGEQTLGRSRAVHRVQQPFCSREREDSEVSSLRGAPAAEPTCTDSSPASDTWIPAPPRVEAHHLIPLPGRMVEEPRCCSPATHLQTTVRSARQQSRISRGVGSLLKNPGPFLIGNRNFTFQSNQTQGLQAREVSRNGFRSRTTRIFLGTAVLWADQGRVSEWPHAVSLRCFV